MNEAVKKHEYDNEPLDEIVADVEEAVKEEQILYGSFIAPQPVPTVTQSDILAALNRNEDGDAALYRSLHKTMFCFDHSIGAWFKWNGIYWEEDKIGDSISSSHAVIEKYLEEAARQASLKIASLAALNDSAMKKADALEKALIKRVHDLQTLKRKKDMLILAAQGGGLTGYQRQRVG